MVLSAAGTRTLIHSHRKSTPARLTVIVLMMPATSLQPATNSAWAAFIAEGLGTIVKRMHRNMQSYEMKRCPVCS